ncbi:hypothetical protein D1872_237860 [compost metagenome]
MATRIRIAPKIKRCIFAGDNAFGISMIPLLESWFSQPVNSVSTCRFRIVTSAAPRMTPGTLPIPPSTTMTRIVVDSMSVKLVGSMKVCLAANTTPIIPEKDAPIAKAVSFVRISGIPMD